ncbi:MAG: CAP domain-containing protein [Acidimicrobiales bacterium]
MAVAALLLTGCLNDQGVRSFDLVNADRGAHGLGELANDFDLNAVAQEWSDHMAATGELAHSGVSIPEGSTRVAENVGYAASVDRVHQLFMESDGHRANILHSAVTRVGIGATVDADGKVWITQIFAN